MAKKARPEGNFRICLNPALKSCSGGQLRDARPDSHHNLRRCSGKDGPTIELKNIEQRITNMKRGNKQSFVYGLQEINRFNLRHSIFRVRYSAARNTCVNKKTIGYPCSACTEPPPVACTAVRVICKDLVEPILPGPLQRSALR